MQHEAHDGEKQAEEQGPREITDLEAGDQGARKEYEEGIQHKNKESQGDDGEGQGKDYEDRSHNGVYETKDEGSDNGCAYTSHRYAGKDIRADQDGDRRDEPAYEQVHYCLL